MSYRFTNREIFNALKNLKTGTDIKTAITKSDIFQTMLLLYFFKNKGNTLDRTELILPNVRLVDLHTDNNQKEKYLQIKYIISDILTNLEKRIDGSNIGSSVPIDSIVAKTNIARIMYFIAMDACDAIVDSTLPNNTQYKAIMNNNTIAIKSSRVSNSTEELSYAKKLFIIASSLSKNEVQIAGNNTQPIHSKKVLDFMNDIVDVQSLFTQENRNKAFYITELQRGDHTYNNTVILDTQYPNIKDVTEEKINLRVIQTVLIGNGVVYNTTDVPKIDVDSEFNDINHIIDMLFKTYYIDPGARVEAKAEGGKITQ